MHAIKKSSKELQRLCVIKMIRTKEGNRGRGGTGMAYLALCNIGYRSTESNCPCVCEAASTKRSILTYVQLDCEFFFCSAIWRRLDDDMSVNCVIWVLYSQNKDFLWWKLSYLPSSLEYSAGLKVTSRPDPARCDFPCPRLLTRKCQRRIFITTDTHFDILIKLFAEKDLWLEIRASRFQWNFHFSFAVLQLDRSSIDVAFIFKLNRPMPSLNLVSRVSCLHGCLFSSRFVYPASPISAKDNFLFFDVPTTERTLSSIENPDVELKNFLRQRKITPQLQIIENKS